MNDNHLEDNIRKLLSSTEPELEMPRDNKQRVLSTLRGRAAKPKMTSGRPLSWMTAAAAAAVLLFLLFWPGGMDGGLAWAEVASHFNEVESLIASLTIEEMPPSGIARVTVGRLYQKDPGMTRSEIFEASSDEPATIVITRSGEERSSIVRLAPKVKIAYRTTLEFSGSEFVERREMSRDIVAEAWARLEKVTADQAASIGESFIDGVLAVGFEIDIREIFKGPQAAGLSGIMRVWAEQLTGVPLRVEAEFLDPSGTLRRTTFSEIEWNAILDEELFEVPDLEGWQVIEEERPR
jgi:outer membrane lipoprotein-sorting protein